MNKSNISFIISFNTYKNNIAMSTYIHPTAVIDEPCQIGDEVHIWHFCHLMQGCRIGNRCNLGQNVFVASNVVLGENVKVQNNVSLYEGVVCEDDVFLGPSMVFTNVLNPRAAVSRKSEYRQTIVRQGATIGANATVVCGNAIGRYALIGAGAVVTKPVPDFALMVGNPAHQIGWVSACGCTLTFDAEGMAVCPECGRRYQLKENAVVEL